MFLDRDSNKFKYVKNIYNKINNKLDTSEETTYFDYPILSENKSWKIDTWDFLFIEHIIF